MRISIVFLLVASVIGYLAERGVLTSWHGEKIGTYRITSTWRMVKIHR